MATEPAFELQVIETGRTDGYWIQNGGECLPHSVGAPVIPALPLVG
jgi:hypothetical protein